MEKPALLIVDEDAAIERDLARRYGENFRAVRAASKEKAIESLHQLKLRGDEVAVLLINQSLAGMNGTGIFERAIQEFPEAKRVLLTECADVDSAIKAINNLQVDHYLMTPCIPPDERLYPVLDDLLADWSASHPPSFKGIRVIAPRWSPKAHEVKDFLARHQLPYQWLDVENDAEAQALVRKAGGDGKLPLVLFPDGSQLCDPTVKQLAEKLGLQTRPSMPHYDLVIVGAGPAGLAGAVYGASEGLKTITIEGEAPGGQAGLSSRIENYLGFPSGLTGGDLTRRAVVQARRFGAEIITSQNVAKVGLNGQYRVVTLSDGTQISCQALLIATGVAYRQLGIPGVDRLAGAGVYYGGAVTEAISCREQDAYVVGGGNAAGQAAMHLSRYARRVTILVRSDSLAKTMSQYLIDEIARTPNIGVRFQTRVIEAHGHQCLERLTIVNDQTGQKECVPAIALFIFIGQMPRTAWIAGLIECDGRGFILAGADFKCDGRRPRNWPLDRDPYLLETSVPGVFVAGDVRHGSIKRVASAVGEGSIAIELIHDYLNRT